jgi:hypothetical protein
VDELLDRLYEDEPEHCCLYSGELPPDLAQTAPYLIKLQAESKFTGWLLREGWGRHWGIFAVSPASIEQLRRHFREFLMVRDPAGKAVYFRYYDPRVLRVYLPSCNEQELETVFGPVLLYVAEGAAPTETLTFPRPASAAGGVSTGEVPNETPVATVRT